MNCASIKKKIIRKRNTVQIVCVNLYFHPFLTIIDIVLVIIFFLKKCLQCIDITLVVWCLKRTHKILTEKIAQLNSAIDDVSTQLHGDDAPNGAAVNSDEVGASM